MKAVLAACLRRAHSGQTLILCLSPASPWEACLARMHHTGSCVGLSSSQKFHREAGGCGRFLTDWEEKRGGAAGIWGLQM